MNRLLRMLVLALLVPANARADLHDTWDALLKHYVDGEGRVAYRRLQRDSLAQLDNYLSELARFDPASVSPPEQIAFWINAYNAHVVRGVLDGYSAEGFIARKRFFSFYSFELAGQQRTLDEIEQQILRKRFTEPRIHFALVCASTSCPQLRAEPYRGDRLDAQLDEQARSFLTDPRRNQIGTGDVVKLSSIFKWFGEDFIKAKGSVPNFIRQYAAIGDPRIEYLDYDWTMNAQTGQRPD